MKKSHRILLIVGVVLLVLVILLTAYFFIGVNAHYFVNLRDNAVADSGWRIDAQHADGIVRYEMEYLDGRVDYIEYNANRECVASEGITPIHFDRQNMWGIWSYEDFVAEYGDYHMDNGNMVFWPGWFTDDGYLIALWSGGERWFPLCISNLGEVWVYDLLATPE